MKKTASLIFSILCMFVFSSTAFPSEPASNLQMFGGKIISIDLEHKTFTLKEDNRGNFTCAFNDSTQVIANRREMKISDLKLGDIAVVVYAEASGRNVAKTISVFAPVQRSH